MRKPRVAPRNVPSRLTPVTVILSLTENQVAERKEGAPKGMHDPTPVKTVLMATSLK